jgi:bacterioferritin-associated ferredoxin
MYVCICNAVTEDDIHCRVASGALTAKQVKNACGWKPGCGACTRRLCAAVDEALAEPVVAEPARSRRRPAPGAETSAA